MHGLAPVVGMWVWVRDGEGGQRKVGWGGNRLYQGLPPQKTHHKVPCLQATHAGEGRRQGGEEWAGGGGKESPVSMATPGRSRASGEVAETDAYTQYEGAAPKSELLPRTQLSHPLSTWDRSGTSSQARPGQARALVDKDSGARPRIVCGWAVMALWGVLPLPPYGGAPYQIPSPPARGGPDQGEETEE